MRGVSQSIVGKCVIVVLAFVFSASFALARNSDYSLNVIQRPNSMIPAIQERGGTFTIKAKTDQVYNARLVISSPFTKSYDLTVESQSYDAGEGVWVATVRIPADTPMELYDLEVNNGTDKNDNAVKVIFSFPTRFYFIHTSDMHFGYSGAEAAFKAIMNDINIINPEFLIETGDNLACGGNFPVSYCLEDQRYSHVFSVWESTVRVPTYIVAGNHDMDHVTCCATCFLPSLCSKPGYQETWRQHVGALYYTFDFGQYHFANIDMSGYATCCPGYRLDDTQAAWLRSDLSSMPGTLRFVAGHQCEAEGGGHSCDTENSELEDICQDYSVSMYLHGHVHDDNVRNVGSTKYIRTKAAMDRHYRLIRINGSSIESYTYAGSPGGSIPGGNRVRVAYLPANDGTAHDVTAFIANDLAERFENSLLKFDMPSSPRGYDVDNGAELQTVRLGDRSIVYVRADARENSVTTVRVRVRAAPRPALAAAAASMPRWLVIALALAGICGFLGLMGRRLRPALGRQT